MKIEPRQFDAFLKRPDARIRGVVVYGNDDGLVAERAAQLARTVCDDLNDPFRVVDIAGDVLKGDPSRLAGPGLPTGTLGTPLRYGDARIVEGD